MALYVEDNEKKFKVLEELAERIGIFLDNINAKFRHKQVRLDRKRGLVVTGVDGRALELSALSSGEQHELVLLFDLLFKVEKNTLVLIDEPELSLHISWQERFLPELLQVVGVGQFDVLLATHSPYIVGDRDDLTVALAAELR